MKTIIKILFVALLIIIVGYLVYLKTNNKNLTINKITLDKKDLNLQVGDTYKLNVIIDPIEAIYEDLTWLSDNTSIAIVDNQGNIKAVSPGVTNIKVKSDNGKEDICTITVNENSIQTTNIKLNINNKTIFVGESFNLIATLTPSNVSDKSIIWTSSNNKIATVKNGEVKGISAGTVTITAANGNIKATCKVVVKIDNSPIASDGTINNDYFNIVTNASTSALAEQTSKGITEAIDYASEHKITNIKLKKGTYIVKTLLHANATKGTVQNVLTAIYFTKSNINFDLNGSTIKLYTNNEPKNRIIYLGHATNVKIYNGTLIGDYDTHTCKDGTLISKTGKCPNDSPTTHEYCHGILIQNSKNVTISNINIKNVVGDGIYINETETKINNYDFYNTGNITISNVNVSNAGRNGISILHCDKIEISNSTFNNTGYGIKVEPNKSNYTVKNYPVSNLTIKNNKIYNNRSHSSIAVFRSYNVTISNNYLSDNIRTCGSLKRDSRCFDGVDDDYKQVKISGNKVMQANETFVANEIVNWNCVGGVDDCWSLLPWKKHDGKWYYVDTKKGILIKNTTKIIDNKSYSFDVNGVCTNK